MIVILNRFLEGFGVRTTKSFVSGRRTCKNERRPGRTGRRLPLIPTMLALAAAAALGYCLNVSVPRSNASPQAAQSPPAPPGGITQVRTSPLDAPLQLLAEAARTYSRVQDYTCTMVKQERVKGQLQPEHSMTVKFRKQPFSVFMQWSAPRNMNGQQVCFVEGKNNGMMRVRSSGLLGAVGWVSISPQDPRALEHSRHTITEAGIGNLLTRIQRDWLQERNHNRSKVSMAEYDFAGSRCIRIEVAHTERIAQAYCYRTVLYLDKQSRLPVRCECYDWPSPGGTPGGELLEVFSYLNMRFNVGLTDREFNF
jgi:hypothetical protein